MVESPEDATVPVSKHHLFERVLRLVSDEGVQSFPLPKSGTLVVGRGSEAQLTIDHGSVSRNHCKITIGDSIELQDLGSTNGTSIAGRPLEKSEKRVWPPGVAASFGNVMALIEGGASMGHGTRGDTEGAEHVVVPGSRLEKLLELARTVARGDISVLVIGETGVGKEVMAEFVHQNSERSGRPFVRINCAALPPNLLESELFGHERGAFTGANHAKPGLLEVANGGTVFLDEIGEMPLELQAKLLRVVENRTVFRVGGRNVKHVDVRFISATNREPENLAADQRMRQDLFFRLAGITLEIPPLRQREDEIVPLSERFLRGFAEKRGMSPPSFSAEAKEALLKHPWPGNVRELRNVMERAALVAVDGMVEASHLFLKKPSPRPVTPFKEEQTSPVNTIPSEVAAAVGAGPTSDANLKDHLKVAEAARIKSALDSCSGNQTKAAELLGVSRRTLVRRMKDLQLDRPRAGRAR